MKTIRTKAIQLLLGFALTLGLMIGLTGPAMAATLNLGSEKKYTEVNSWTDLQDTISASSPNNPAYLKLGTDLTNTNNYLNISKNDSTNIIHVVYLDLAGYTLSRGLNSPVDQGNVIRVVNGGQLTLKDSSNGNGKITGGYVTNFQNGLGGGVFVGSINEYVEQKSYFTMEGGTIEGNKSTNEGGGVYVGYNGNFEMKGGTIQNNSAGTNGGGVFLCNKPYYSDHVAHFTMTGGTIGGKGTTKGNTATNGGGVYIGFGSSFTMNGGIIGCEEENDSVEEQNDSEEVNQGNSANRGGGVCVGSTSSRGTFTMNGGTISGNNANSLGGGVYIDYHGAFTMGNSTTEDGQTISGIIQNNHANSNGGGVYLTGSDSIFNLTSGTISENTAQNGGGVFATIGTFTLTSGAIKGNTATGNGGGIYSGINLTIDKNTIIQSNQAANGGGVYNTNTFTMQDGAVIDKNTATANGGGVYNTGTFTMTGGTIGGNQADSGNHAANGGGVYIAESGSFSLTKGAIKGNTASASGEESYGGGVYVNSGAFTMNSTTGAIENNEATNGGGVFIAENSTFTLKKGTIKSNIAANGGGIYSNIRLSIGIGADILRNSAANGGGVYVNKSTFTVSGSTIQYNIATTNGGGVYVAESGSFTVDSTTGAIQNNEATNGGGVYIAKSGSFNMTKGTIQSNKATNGGGIYSCVDFSIGSDALIQENTADNGGGVYVNSGAFTMTDGNLLSNTATQNGGGVFIAESGSFTLSKGLVQNNTAGTAEYEVDGGGVYVNGGTFTMTGGNLQSNTATANGGGVYIAENSTFTLNKGEIKSNKATANGGGIYSCVDFSIGSGADIQSNIAANGGGVYVNTGDTFTMSGGAIDGNTATENGGGVYVNGGTFNMSGGNLQSNTATANGGGVYIAEKVTQGETTYNSTFNMSGGNIGGEGTGNQAVNGGGVYVSTGGTFSMNSPTESTQTVDGTIQSNTATANGGGIYAATNIKLDGKPSITDNKVSNAANNVYLAKDVKIDVGNNLQPTQKIGVTISKRFDIITVNANYTSHEEARADFQSDDSNKEVYKTLKGTQARLGPKIPHTVTLVGGNHATADGPTTQEDLTEPMQPVTYTANYGYQFPQSSPYYTTTEGITVQRTGQSTVTVSGEPTKTVTITVPDAVPKSRVSHTVTFKVEHGAWDDGTTEDKTVTLSGYADETLKLKQDQIPAVGDKPDNYYKAGNWDTVPSPDTPITEDMTYTYTYEKQAVVMPTLYFAAHVQNYGWDKKNQVLEPGKTADVGTTGQSLRVEDLAVIVPKDLKVDGYAHVQNVGDMAVKKVESTKDYTIPEGYVSYEFGTTGKSQRVEAVCISIKDPDGQYITGFQYAVHLQNYGWQGYVRNGSFAGTRGMALRMEALRFAYTKDDVVKPGEP